MSMIFEGVQVQARYPASVYVPPPAPVAPDLSLPALPAITRYIDPELGNDANNGLTPETAWRHFPGQAGETGVVAAYNPQPGDHLAMKRGARFTGRISPRTSGTADERIVYSGNAWGPGTASNRAFYDGAAPCTVRAVTNQADAGGASNWNDPAMRIVEWVDDGRETMLYDDAGLLFVSQFPRPLNPYLLDDLFGGPGLTYQVSGTDLINTQTINNATVAAQAAGEEGVGTVWVWVTGSQFAVRTITDVTGNVTSLSAGAISPYTPNTLVFLRNCVKHVTAAGDFAVLAPGKALVKTRGNLNIRRGQSTGSVITQATLRISARAYLDFRGFRFSGFTNVDAISFTSTPPVANNVRILDNVLEHCWNQAPIGTTWGEDIEVAYNRIQYVPLAGGISDQGPRAWVHHNVVHTVGGTAIPSSRNTQGSVLEYNIVSNSNGVHANGASVYANQRGNRFRFNCFWGMTRPLTHQIAISEIVTSDREFEGNIFRARFTAEEQATAGIYAFRTNTNRNIDGYKVVNNICSGANNGILIPRTATNVTLTGNLTIGGISYGTANPDQRGTWTIADNSELPADFFEQSGQVMEVDRVYITRPDDSVFNLDLRNVGV